MPTKKYAPAKPRTRPAALRQPSPYHRIDALLQTIRCVAQYEDALCELSHELKGSAALSAEASEELRDILKQIPSHDYLLDLESVRAILVSPSKRSSSKKATNAIVNRTDLPSAKKKPRRQSSK
jgi:hypothetical protein